MKMSLSQLEDRRQQILRQISALERLRRGTLSRQFFKKRGSGLKARQGPYYLLQGYIQGRKFSQRVPAQQAPQFKSLVASYKRFVQLAEQLVAVTDKLTRLTQEEGPLTQKASSSQPQP
jgi:uncharacterized protein DUF6788